MDIWDFIDKKIIACQLGEQIAAIPQKVLYDRNDVKAILFHLGYHYPNDKNRFGGPIRHKM